MNKKELLKYIRGYTFTSRSFLHRKVIREIDKWIKELIDEGKIALYKGKYNSIVNV